MGLFDYVYCRGPEFVCSEGHDLGAEEFQSKDFGCEMGHVLIENGRIATQAVCLGKPEVDGNKAEVYCTCKKCPAFVQFGTGNIVACDVTFEVEIDGDAVAKVTRTSPTTADWLIAEPQLKHMSRCEGPMPYDAAQELHCHYKRMRPEHADEFRAWATARSAAIRAGAAWSLDLPVGEYPQP